MSIIIDDHCRVHGNIAEDLARLEVLAHDLGQFAAGTFPTQAQLEAAPLLDHWRLATREALCLAGRCTDRPHLAWPGDLHQ